MNFRTAFAPFVAPISDNEDTRRREFILNILLVASILLLTISLVSSSITSLFITADALKNDGESLVLLGVELGIFIGLYLLSRNKFVDASAYLFVTIFFLLSLYFAYRWGPDVLVAVLFYTLTIVMAGILLNSRMAFAVAIAFGVLIPLIDFLQTSALLSVNTYWRNEHMLLSDALVISVILILIALVSWLSNREIGRSLIRAKQSEAELIVERDLLEDRVIERTEEIRKLEMEKMSQTYHFVEFGRLAGGLFHDLINPISALSLNIESIASAHNAADEQKLHSMTEDIIRAQHTMGHTHKLMQSMRKYLIHDNPQEKFPIVESIEEVVNILISYARLRNVTITSKVIPEVYTYGDPIAFTQVLTNIITNAIESFGVIEPFDVSAQTVFISVFLEGTNVCIEVNDTGAGMPQEVLEKIFNPFYSTKGDEGLGIGLSLAKRIVEKKFEGTLSVASEVGIGTTFTIYFPLREP